MCRGVETTGRIELGVGTKACAHKLCCQDSGNMGISKKLGVLASGGTLPKTLDLEKCATAVDKTRRRRRRRSSLFIGVPAIFGGGLDRFCPKNMGQRPKN